jgi:hypothetical protein
VGSEWKKLSARCCNQALHRCIPGRVKLLQRSLIDTWVETVCSTLVTAMRIRRCAGLAARHCAPSGQHNTAISRLRCQARAIPKRQRKGQRSSARPLSHHTTSVPSPPTPSAPQRPALQRPERFVERGPAPPPKVDPITAALEREHSSTPRDTRAHGSAPGGRRDKEREPQGGRKSLAEWRVHAQRTGSSVSWLNYSMVQLQRVCGADVEADASGVMQDTLQRLRSDVDAGDGRLASLLGGAVQAHTPLAAAIAADAGASAQIAQALGRAAKQEATYTNDFCTAQMATAQDKLRQSCAVFWRELERRGLKHAGPRGVATVVHRVGVLAGEQGLFAPSDDLWDVLEAGIASTAEEMDAQQVSNCWHAFAKLARKPRHAADTALSRALLRRQHEMVPRNVSNTLWAFANTWWALASLGWPVHDQLRAGLLAAAQRTSKHMNAQHVSNVWYALALLGVRPRGAPRDALDAAAVRVSVHMEPQHVANTLWSLAKLGLPLCGELQAALLAAVPRVSEQMTGQGAAMAVWAVGEFACSLALRCSARCASPSCAPHAPCRSTQKACAWRGAG